MSYAIFSKDDFMCEGLDSIAAAMAEIATYYGQHEHRYGPFEIMDDDDLTINPIIRVEFGPMPTEA